MTPRSIRIGLTGGLAAGKSTVARLLRQAGAEVVDADDLVAELYAPGAAGAGRVREIFGDTVFLADGRVDHSAVARLVFADAGARRRLEGAIHPLVRDAFGHRAARAEAQGKRIVVLEAPVLAEAGFAGDFDAVVTVEANPELRIERAVARGMSPDDARARMAAQDDRARLAIATHVLHNDGTVAELEARVAALLTELEAEAPIN